MALGDEVLGQIGDDAFRSPIEPRRNAFHRGSDLGDLHLGTVFYRRKFGVDAFGSGSKACCQSREKGNF
jgi:hypothetical protein